MIEMFRGRDRWANIVFWGFERKEVLENGWVFVRINRTKFKGNVIILNLVAQTMKVSVSLSKRAGYKQLELKFPQTANLKFLPLPEKQDNTNISTNGSIPLSEERNQPSSRTDKS